jgi:hypothetical protein
VWDRPLVIVCTIELRSVRSFGLSTLQFRSALGPMTEVDIRCRLFCRNRKSKCAHSINMLTVLPVFPRPMPSGAKPDFQAIEAVRGI